MSSNPVRKLHSDLVALKKAKAVEARAVSTQKADSAAEKAALAQVKAQEKALIDAFVAAPTTDPAALQKLLGQLVTLGGQEVSTKDRFDAKLAQDGKAIAADKKTVAQDRKQALKDLVPAEYKLSLRDTNSARAQLGLKPLKAPLRESFKPGSWKPGPGSLQGADTSAWQSDAEFNASIRGAKWSVIKATEGTNWNDPTFKARWNKLGQLVKSGQMKLRMAYLFLHPGNAVTQAKHFLDQVGVHGKLPAGTRLALDWEGAAFSDPAGLGQAARYIHQVTGVWPVVYVQGSKVSAARAAAPNCPIWEAAYGSGVNRSVPFFQYSDGPGYDHDVFNGNLAALEKFAGY